MTAAADRWGAMVQALAGNPPPPPPPPARPGRVHRQPWPTFRDPVADEHDALEVRLQPGWWAKVGGP